MKTRIDFRRIAGLALVAAAIALYVRDCGRRQTEQTAVLAVRAMVPDPGSFDGIVGFRTPFVGDPDADVGATDVIFHPLRDPAAASNVVAALAATEAGWKPDTDHPVSSLVVEHDVVLLATNRPPAFFHLRRSDGDSRVFVQPRNPAAPFAGPPAVVPVMSAAGLDGILKLVESGELVDTNLVVRFVVAFTVPTNAPAGASEP